MSEELREAMPAAVAAYRDVVLGVRDDQLDLPTPCAEYDVRGLLNHLLYWAPRLAAAARRQPAPPADSGEEHADLVHGDWAARAVAHADGLADALAEPAAWQGSTVMSTELPAAMVGAMAFGELVVHSWDLAVATGQPFHCAGHVAEAVLHAVEGFAEQGREYGVFGAAVPVPAAAPALDRALGLSGRDPAWSPLPVG